MLISLISVTLDDFRKTRSCKLQEALVLKFAKLVLRIGFIRSDSLSNELGENPEKQCNTD